MQSGTGPAAGLPRPWSAGTAPPRASSGPPASCRHVPYGDYLDRRHPAGIRLPAVIINSPARTSCITKSCKSCKLFSACGVIDTSLAFHFRRVCQWSAGILPAYSLRLSAVLLLALRACEIYKSCKLFSAYGVIDTTLAFRLRRVYYGAPASCRHRLFNLLAWWVLYTGKRG